MSEIAIKNHFSPSERVRSPKGTKPAKQEFKDDADINVIMRKFQKTGAINHVAKYQGEYGMATPVSLHQAMNLVAKAQSMFEDLPSSVRNEFGNDPRQFLEFVQDPQNAARAAELNIALAPEAAEKAAEIAAEAARAAGSGEPGNEPAGDPPVPGREPGGGGEPAPATE